MSGLKTVEETLADLENPETVGWQYSSDLKGLLSLGAHHIRAQASRIAELEAVLEKLRLEASRASLFYPIDLALMQEEINSVLPPAIETE